MKGEKKVYERGCGPAGPFLGSILPVLYIIEWEYTRRVEDESSVFRGTEEPPLGEREERGHGEA
eukprot:scaffold318038_cov37-Tisochrysis_lutea.AAC.1